MYPCAAPAIPGVGPQAQLWRWQAQCLVSGGGIRTAASCVTWGPFWADAVSGGLTALP